MRPRAPRQTDWAQLGIGACALLLPPLALGAALYSMLAPDDGTTRPAGSETVLSDDSGQQPASPAATGLRATAAEAAAARPQPAGPFADGKARQDRTPAPDAPIPAVAVYPPAYAESATMPPPAENQPATAAPRRSINRNAQRQQQQQQQQQQDPLTALLQRIGVLPPYH